MPGAVGLAAVFAARAVTRCGAGGWPDVYAATVGPMVTKQRPTTARGVGVHARNAQLRTEYRTLETTAAAAEARGDATDAAQLRSKMSQLAARFISLNDGLIGPVVSRYRLDRSRDNWQDYAQAGRLGLWEAFLKWDPDRGTTFGGFSRPYIDGRVRRAVARYEHNGKSYEDFCAVPKIRQLVDEHDLDGTDTELISSLTGDQHGTAKITAKTIEVALMGAPSSLDAPVGDDNGATRGELVAAPQIDTGSLDLDPRMLRDVTQDLTARELWLVLRRGVFHDGRFPLDGSSVDSDYYQLADMLGDGREGLRKAHQVAAAIVLKGPKIRELALEEFAGQLDKQRAAVASAYHNGHLPTLRQAAGKYRLDEASGTLEFVPKFNFPQTTAVVKADLDVEMTVTRLRSLMWTSLPRKAQIDVGGVAAEGTSEDVVSPDEVQVLIGVLFDDQPYATVTLADLQEQRRAARKQRAATAPRRKRLSVPEAQLAFDL